MSHRCPRPWHFFRETRGWGRRRRAQQGRFLEADPYSHMSGVGAEWRVHIRQWVHVHENTDSMCAPALPYVAGCLAVAPRHASIGIGEVRHVHAHATLRRGVAPVQRSLREGFRPMEAAVGHTLRVLVPAPTGIGGIADSHHWIRPFRSQK